MCDGSTHYGDRHGAEFWLFWLVLALYAHRVHTVCPLPVYTTKGDRLKPASLVFGLRTRIVVVHQTGEFAAAAWLQAEKPLSDTH